MFKVCKIKFLTGTLEGMEVSEMVKNPEINEVRSMILCGEDWGTFQILEII